jgi:hypothetical protein
MKSKRALPSSLRLAKLILSKTQRVSRSLDGRNKEMLSLGQGAMTLLEIFSASEHTRPSGAEKGGSCSRGHIARGVSRGVPSVSTINEFSTDLESKDDDGRTPL